MKNFFVFKFSFTFLCWLFLNTVSSCSKSKRIQTDEENQRSMMVKNKIKTITEYRTSVFLGLSQPEQFSQVKHFDTYGFIVNETDYKLDGTTDCMLSYEYDKNGNLILINAINPDSSFLFRETRNYDENKNRKEFYFFLPDGSYKYRNVATYDENERMTELAWYWPSGLKSKNKYEYEGRKKISDSEYDPGNILKYKWTYKYDQKENLIEAIQYSPSAIINIKITYEFNDKNQKVKETCYADDDIQNSTTFLYDEKNSLLSKKLFSPSGKITATFRYQYEYR